MSDDTKKIFERLESVSLGMTNLIYKIGSGDHYGAYLEANLCSSKMTEITELLLKMSPVE